MTEFPC